MAIPPIPLTMFQVVEGVKHVIDCLNESNFTAQSNNRKIAVLGAYLHCLLLISEVIKISYFLIILVFVSVTVRCKKWYVRHLS